MCFIAGWNGQPRFCFAEAGIAGVIPLHGGAFAVAAFFQGPAELADGILHVLLAFWVIVFHADFFAVVHDGGSAEGQVKTRHHFGDVVVVRAVGVARVGTHDVVVGDDIDGPVSGGVHGGDVPAVFIGGEA